MADDQSWNAKKDEIWKRLGEVEGTAAELKSELANVANLAASKITDDETVAKKAAQQAEAGAKKVAEVVMQTEILLPQIAELQQDLPTAQVDVSTVRRHAEESQTNSIDIVGFKAAAEKATNEIVAFQEKAKKAVEDAEVKWATTNQQVQNIANLNAQASADAATAKTSKENIQNIQQEVVAIKADFETMRAEWENTFAELNKRHDEALGELYKSRELELNKLLDTRSKELVALNEKYIQEFETRTKEIETLLPGATSAGLASAFADRKQDIQKNQKWWAWLLIGSAIALVGFGVFSLTPWGSEIGIASSFAGRIVIIAGLILLEEFARRNFNIISRLAESYAYKEALAKSYFGYKKQMEEIPMPAGKEGEKIMGHSALMKAFLEKLEDEPGKHVFDREKQIIGPGAIIDKLSPNNKAGATGEALQELSRGNLLTKISWPIVAVVAILAITACVIAYLLKNQLS